MCKRSHTAFHHHVKLKATERGRPTTINNAYQQRHRCLELLAAGITELHVFHDSVKEDGVRCARCRLRFRILTAKLPCRIAKYWLEFQLIGWSRIQHYAPRTIRIHYAPMKWEDSINLNLRLTLEN